MTLGIAFEGCACRAAFQVGAVRFLQQRGVDFVASGGASSGSIVAAAVALGRLQEVEARFLGFADVPVFQPRRVLRGRWPFVMSEVLGRAVQQSFGPLRLPDVPRPLAIPITVRGRLRSRVRVLTRRDDLPLGEAIRASCFIPGPYSRPVRIQGRFAFDGAYKVRTPVDEVAALGAKRVIAVITNPQGRLRQGGVRESGPLAAPKVDHRVLHPHEELPVVGFDIDRERFRAAMAMGEQAAADFARRHERWLGG